MSGECSNCLVAQVCCEHLTVLYEKVAYRELSPDDWFEGTQPTEDGVWEGRALERTFPKTSKSLRAGGRPFCKPIYANGRPFSEKEQARF